MNISTKTHWQWTAHAEAVAKERNLDARKAGTKLMERNRSNEWVTRQTVPASWVEKGYVVEAEVEQTNLF